MTISRKGTATRPSRLALVGLLLWYLLPAHAMAAKCVVKEIEMESGEIDSIVLMVSKKDVARMEASGFQSYECLAGQNGAKKFEKLVCGATNRQSELLRRALEAHYQMSVSELCELTRGALKEK